MENPRKILKVLLLAVIILALAASSVISSHAAFNSLLRDIPKLTGISEILLLESLDDGSIIFNQNDTVRTAPASLTKIVTAILALEECKSLDDKITVKPYCISMFYGTNSSNAGLKPGEIATVEQLLYCMLLPSANEAAAILADYIAGSQEAFVAMMNAFVQRLGCKDTHFMNAHGIDEEGHYTTARDIAVITRYALSSEFKGNALFEKITATRTYEMPPTNRSPKRNLINTNKMMSSGYKDYYSADVAGIKTGTTKLAGDCVVAMASRGGFHYICVVMRGDKRVVPPESYLKNTAFVDAKALLDWSFAHIKWRQVTETAKAVAEIRVEMARNTDHVQLVPAEALAAFVPEGIDSSTVLVEPIPEKTPESIVAPVKKGQVIGRARILYAGEEFAQVNLMAAESISRSATMFLVSLAKQAIRSPLAKAMLFAVLLAAAIYLAVVLLQSRKKRSERQLRIMPDVSKNHRK